MNKEEEETINLAVKTLENQIKRLIQKRKEKHGDADASTSSSLKSEQHNSCIQRLLDHTRHLLVDLTKKRHTLKAFLQWFAGEWSRVERFLPQAPLQILEHALQQFLRCQDGLMMLTSGECRHPYDLRTAQKNHKYKSRLSTLRERGDGYTLLYNGVYSGFGWDEFHNEQVGIKVLLIRALKRYHKAPWEYLERQNATDALESVFDRHESAVKDIQQDLQALKRKILGDITQRLKPRNLKFATQDKMERLSLIVHEQKIDLQRRADAFQIKGSVLPCEKQRPEDWRSFALNVDEPKGNDKPDNNDATKKRKRRVVLSDSEDDNDENGEKSTARSQETPTKAKGLVVRVEKSQAKPESEALNEIKLQMGVSANELEDARESLEGEDAVRRGAPKAVCLEEEKVKRLKKILSRALSRSEVDDDEVWDARECLRLAHMEAGNYHLWDNKARGSSLLAREHFESAKKLVEELQQSHKKLSRRPGYDEDSADFVDRNLLFLEGQATINVGIAMLESLNGQTKQALRAIKAVPKFEFTTECASKMRQRIPAKSPSLEEISDLLKADYLESMACRWMGKAFWMAGNEKRAIEMLELASFFVDDRKSRQCDLGLEDDVLDLAAECLYATYVLSDLACSKLDQLARTLSFDEGNRTLEVVKRSLLRHNGIIELVRQRIGGDGIDTFCSEKDISSSDDVDKHLQCTIEWWKEVRNPASRANTQSLKQRQRPQLKRSDLSSSANVSVMSEPTQDEINRASWRQKPKLQGHNAGNKTKGHNPIQGLLQVTPDKSSEARPPEKYMPWGDEFFWMHRQEQLGLENLDKSKLPYPSCAPPMPEEFKKFV
jgi:hypothetical protein